MCQACCQSLSCPHRRSAHQTRLAQCLSTSPKIQRFQELSYTSLRLQVWLPEVLLACHTSTEGYCELPCVYVFLCNCLQIQAAKRYTICSTQSSCCMPATARRRNLLKTEQVKSVCVLFTLTSAIDGLKFVTGCSGVFFGCSWDCKDHSTVVSTCNTSCHAG